MTPDEKRIVEWLREERLEIQEEMILARRKQHFDIALRLGSDMAMLLTCEKAIEAGDHRKDKP